MASPLSVLKAVIPLNCTHVESLETVEVEEVRYGETHVREEIHVHCRPFQRKQCLCPKCGRRCPKDGFKRQEESSWRATDLNGTRVYMMYRPQRIKCPEHGEINEWIPWEDVSGRFTPDFNNEVAWLACQMSKTAISTFLGINWRTVGNCLGAAHGRLEPDVTERLHCGLTRICVDETSYSKGHSYVTVVYDMERNRVVWVHDRHGKKVFEQFCLALTEEERAAIEVVAGDGALWIDECVAKYFPNAKRCVDFFHVVEWANEALDHVRVGAAAKARREHARMLGELERVEAEAARAREEAERSLAEARAELAAMPVRGRPSRRKLELRAYIAELEGTLAEDAAETRARTVGKGRNRRRVQLTLEHWAVLDDLEESAKSVKGSKHALGHAPENRTANQDQMVALIEAEQPDLWLAFQLKERLRLILHMSDADEAAAQLDEWVEDARSCGIAAMADLADKIAKHRQNILNSVRHKANSAKSESCNTTIKALIKMARGFRNLDNMMALIYLKCSDIVVPLRNRPQPSAQWQRIARDRANERRRQREEERRMQVLSA